MLKRIIIAVVLLASIVFAIKYKKRGSEKDFAMDLAKKCAELVNNGPVKVPGHGEERIFADPDFELKLIQQSSIFGTYDGEVEMDKYNSGIGELSGKLEWKLDYITPPNTSLLDRVPWDAVVHTFSGRVKDDDGEQISINFSFKTPRGEGFPEKPYDVDAIILQEGFVQIGEKEPVRF